MAVDKLDIPRESGLVRQLRFEQDGLAIFDASPNAVAVNWSSIISPSGFVRAINEIADLHKADVTMGLWNQSLQELPGVDDLIANSRGHGFDKDCQFLRLDILETQSVFYQVLSSSDPVLVGFADVPHEIIERDQLRVEALMRATAQPPDMVGEMLDTLSNLARTFK